ncbi:MULTISPECIES: hypothetical protein [Cyanophyceae]|uniref:hypothetical protein n=1 Tax=Cyanophyceae TaxID=3028117 RepID=UPI00168204C8|nr:MULTISPECIES: hypothetical protein [Cyanophyceae]MBD1918880.1 hypothetical protein [Phormidium sp. FACHB-77]MBD2033278.1 hypothetical protein [Phormidium sp. FACHB-322]MBD2053789.1 hypothetical protein [Leptolyngbya sp. FACHB-60]
MQPFAEHHPDDAHDNLMIFLTGQPMPPKVLEDAYIERHEPTALLLRRGHLHYWLNQRLTEKEQP